MTLVSISVGELYVADRVGFEPTRAILRPYALSRGAPSAARPPVRAVWLVELRCPNQAMTLRILYISQMPCGKFEASEGDWLRVGRPLRIRLFCEGSDVFGEAFEQGECLV